MEPGRVNQKLSAKQVSRRRENTPGAQGCWGTEVEKEEQEKQREEAEQGGLHTPQKVGMMQAGLGESEEKVERVNSL